MAKLNRSLDRYEGCEAYAISSGSPAQMAHFITDAKHDIATLAEALRQCQSALSMMIAPDAIKTTTVVNAFAQCSAAEAKARVLLGDQP
tara:strand:+ start:6135 stop:6401 length:267 start_codon:yes stop_codon:yes gene_type:complete